MFDAHAHIGDILTEDALICTSQSNEYTKVRMYPHRAYGLLPPLSGKALEELYSAVQGDSSSLIGEFGVDRRYDDPAEEEVLLSILELAHEADRCFILHQVGHTDRLLKALDQFTSLPPFIVHGFTGSAETAREISRRGGIISLGPRSENTRDFRKLLTFPFLLETDLPVGRQQKHTIELWYDSIAKHLDIDVEDLSEIIDGRRAVFTP